MFYNTPGTIVVRSSVPRVVVIEVINVVHPVNIIRGPDGNIKPEGRGHDEIRWFCNDDPGQGDSEIHIHVDVEFTPCR